MEIALIGNPNSGKTTLFNELTGANQHVGNWPGVTVEQKLGQLKPQYGNAKLVDLPGIYSLSPFSLEEVVSRDYLLRTQPDVVINIVDATNLERNLYLTIQLIELNAPVVMALNMMDEVRAAGYRIDTERLSRDLGIPVIGISAAHHDGLDQLMSSLADAQPSRRHILPNPQLETVIAAVQTLLKNHLASEHRIGDAEAAGYPLHWSAIKVLEGDDLVQSHLTLDQATLTQIQTLIKSFESESGPLSTAFAQARYQLIHRIIYHDVTVWSADGSHHHHLKHAPQGYLLSQHEENELFSAPHFGGEADEPDEKDEVLDSVGGVDAVQRLAPSQHSQQRSDALDRILTHRIWGLPIFLAIFFLMFHLTFSRSLLGIPGLLGPGVFLQDGVRLGLAALVNLVRPLFVSGSWLESLVIDGIIGGVGTILSFVPQIILLFFFLTLLEDCGYMARVAFIMDRFLKPFGLSGKSFVPMLIGFGCTVPAVLAARTMDNPKERRLTLMLVPFMSCGARAPIYLVLAGAFFPTEADLVVYGLYLLGIAVAMGSGILLSKTLLKGAASPFIIELPRYRQPHWRSLLLALWDKLKGYLVRAGTIILAMSVVLWWLCNFGIIAGQLQMVSLDQSFLVVFGRYIAPAFQPLGFGFWEATVALLTGFIAKESVISTLGTLTGLGSGAALTHGLSAGALAAVGFTPLGALAFMVFCLLYIPCVAAFATLKKEFGSWRWAIGQAVFSIAVAYMVALAVYQLGLLILA